jgi:hypothetical protein
MQSQVSGFGDGELISHWPVLAVCRPARRAREACARRSPGMGAGPFFLPLVMMSREAMSRRLSSWSRRSRARPSMTSSVTRAPPMVLPRPPRTAHHRSPKPHPRGSPRWPLRAVLASVGRNQLSITSLGVRSAAAIRSVLIAACPPARRVGRRQDRYGHQPGTPVRFQCLLS